MNRIKEVREQKGFSQSDVAKNLGITRQAVSLYEKGRREPKLETWQKLADFFGVSVPYLQGISDIEDIDFFSSFDNFYSNLEKVGDKVKVPIDDMLALYRTLKSKLFLKITESILNGQNEHLSENGLKEYRKIAYSLDEKNLADIGELNNVVTDIYLIMLNAMQGKKKDKDTRKKIRKILNDYEGIDPDDYPELENDEPIKIKKIPSNKNKD